MNTRLLSLIALLAPLSANAAIAVPPSPKFNARWVEMTLYYPDATAQLTHSNDAFEIDHAQSFNFDDEGEQFMVMRERLIGERSFTHVIEVRLPDRACRFGVEYDAAREALSTVGESIGDQPARCRHTLKVSGNAHRIHFIMR